MDCDALYREVTERHGAALARVAASYEVGLERRRELLQSIHASVWKSLALFDHRLPLRTWVYRVAHNVGASHLVQRVGTRFGERRPLDRQMITLHQEGLDALVIAEITGLTPSNVALALHRLRAAIQEPREDPVALPTAFTIAQLQERGMGGAAGETAGFLERLLAERRSGQLFRLGASVILVPLLLFIRPASEYAPWALLVLVLLLGVGLFLAGRQLLELGSTTRALAQTRLPTVPQPRRLPGPGVTISLSMVAVTLGVPALISLEAASERGAREHRREQAVETVTRCLDPRANDPECVSVVGDRKPRQPPPLAPPSDCAERRRSLAATADVGAIELALLEAVNLGEQCPEELLLPAAILKKDLLRDVTDAARRVCVSNQEDALVSCRLYARLACPGKSAVWRERNEAFLTFLSLREQKELRSEPWECAESPVVGLLLALEAARPDGVSVTALEVKAGMAKLTGVAERQDQLTEFMRRLDDLVRTPSGLGRVTARGSDGYLRAELLGSTDVLELAPGEVRPLFGRAEVASVHGGEAPDAGSRLEFAVKLTLGREALPNGKAWTARYVPDVIVEHFGAVVREDPQNADAWLSLGYAKKAQNKPQDAIAAFKKYLELRPEAPTRKQLEDQIYLLGGQ